MCGHTFSLSARLTLGFCARLQRSATPPIVIDLRLANEKSVTVAVPTAVSLPGAVLFVLFVRDAQSLCGALLRVPGRLTLCDAVRKVVHDEIDAHKRALQLLKAGACRDVEHVLAAHATHTHVQTCVLTSLCSFFVVRCTAAGKKTKKRANQAQREAKLSELQQTTKSGLVRDNVWAKAVALEAPRFEARLGFKKPDVDDEIVFFSQGTTRAHEVAEAAEQTGYKRVAVLAATGGEAIG